MANNQLREELILWTGQFDKKIDDVMKQINKLNRQGRDLGGGFNGSFSSMSSGLKEITSLAGKAGAALGAIGVGVNLTQWLGDTMQKASQLSMEAEGVKLAFDRLNKPDLLDNLNRATHNTISNLELMKQAVKFKDFNLNIEQMGTYLAFAQQKAKDTGESIDYLVNSITTGLGRQSLQILDNLGLSAAEIKNEMKKGGDMTTAVANIIKQRMKEAGDYVETAADRAARKEKELNDALVDLGNTFQTLKSPVSDLFNYIEVGAVNALNKVISLFTVLTEAGRQMNLYKQLGGDSKVDKMISMLGNGKGDKAKNTQKKQLAEFDRKIKDYEQYIADSDAWEKIRSISAYERKIEFEKRTGITVRNDAKDALAATKQMRAAYLSRSSALIVGATKTKTTGGGDNKGKGKKVDTDDFTEIIGLVNSAQEHVDDLQRQIRESWDEGEIAKLTKDLKIAEKELQRLKDIGKEKQMTQGLSGFNAQTMGAWMQGRQSDLSKVNYGSTDYKKIIGNIVDMNTIKNVVEKAVENGIDLAEFDMDGMWEKVFDGEDIPDSVFKKLEREINLKLAALKINAIKIDFKTGNVSGGTAVDEDEEKKKEKEKEDKELQKKINKLKEVKGAINDVGSAIQSLGDVTEEPAFNVIGTIGQAIANVGLGYSIATTQAAKMGPWAWIAFAAEGLVQMLAVISAIKSATSGYANGGVIGGSSFAGDNLLARVNSGEMILNSSQQRNLFHLLDNGGAIGGGGQVEFVLKGQDLYGSMKNYSRIKAMSGINTGIK